MALARLTTDGTLQTNTGRAETHLIRCKGFNNLHKNVAEEILKLGAAVAEPKLNDAKNAVLKLASQVTQLEQSLIAAQRGPLNHGNKERRGRTSTEFGGTDFDATNIAELEPAYSEQLQPQHALLNSAVADLAEKLGMQLL